MTIQNSDPRLTAYALGEIQGEKLVEFEAELARDERARAEISAIRGVSAELERELSKPSGLALSARHVERITNALDERRKLDAESVRPKRRLRSWLAISLAAALPLLGVGLLVTRDKQAHDVARYVAQSATVPATEVDALKTVPLELAVEGQGTGSVRKGAGGPVQSFSDAPAGNPASPNRESYDQFEDNPFVRVGADPRSTFSIDVDTASYALVRRFLNQGQRPPRGAVRIEELLNYFTYSYPEPSGGEPFSLSADVASAPWAPDHRLVRIGLKARDVKQTSRQASNLVFLIDVSGSMNEPNKLPLVKEGLSMLARELDERDRVAIVVYAGASGLVLPPTAGSDRGEIVRALDRLQAGGSTNGGQGIELAYSVATRAFVPDGVNRVILATDGDFNVGVTSQSELVDLIERKAKSGVFLSVLGFGQGNYQDSMLEKLADKGNGNYAYIDGRNEARKVLVEQASGTLITVAKDVKIQLEFNPREVEAFRLIGYENRRLAHQAFNDDRKDAGEIGAGHTVTALYELIPAGGRVPGSGLDGLRYQKAERSAPLADVSGELLHIKLRYKLPSEATSRLLERGVKGSEQRMSPDFRFAAAVAELGMLLRESPYKGESSYAGVLELAEPALGNGREREARSEFLDLVQKARVLAGAEP